MFTGVLFANKTLSLCLALSVALEGNPSLSFFFMSKDRRHLFEFVKHGENAQVSSKRTRSSPELESVKRRQKDSKEMQRTPTKGKSPQMDRQAMEDIMAAFSDRMMDKFSSILDSKNYITKAEVERLESMMGRLHDENKSLRSEVENLKKREMERERKLEVMENQMRKNNLFFKNMSPSDTRTPKEIVGEFCSEILKVGEVRVVEARWVGSNKAGSTDKTVGNILATFLDSDTISRILKNTKNLKGTNFIVQRDLAHLTQVRRGKLLGLRKEIMKLKKDIRVVVSYDRMFANNKKFEWDLARGISFCGGDGLGKLNELVEADMTEAVTKLMTSPQRHPTQHQPFRFSDI